MHWSYFSKDLKIMGVNAYAFLTLVPFLIRPYSLTFGILVVLAFLFFIITEYVFKLKIIFVWDAIRYLIMGKKKAPQNSDFDF
ncbi:hypothetical protein A7M79_07150 [Acinetobacter baumannii]|uniref:hypothetical protein n=1 Tax=Acinetobacter baumannii TaxID=470 RepID=UPI0008DC8F8A|nr:hypothetical protein [Acinetobacter baumannii]OIH08583.1 hypothetical protein A7M79_07150 [Acinetobacter baumannii]